MGSGGKRGAHMKFLYVLGTCSLVAIGACTGPAAPDDVALFRVDVGSESFTISILDEAVASEADRRIQEDEGVALVVGKLARSDGGFNMPWNWHILPNTVQISDNAAEVCDGMPSMVEADLDYWVDTVKQFCPWTGRLVERKQ